METVNEPGATFFLEHSEIKQAPNGSYVGNARLSATVHDLELWEMTIEHLNGMVLHRGKDFKSELIDVLQVKNTELEDKVETEHTILQGELEQARTQANHADAEKVRANQRARLLAAQVETLKADLAQMTEWYKKLQG
jgi:predicted ribosome quality control (RQC) complex YloA/Tae2 family protein